MSTGVAIAQDVASARVGELGAGSDDALQQLLLDALPTGALLVDGAGKIVMLNGQAERLLGRSAVALLGHPAQELFDC